MICAQVENLHVGPLNVKNDDFSGDNVWLSDRRRHGMSRMVSDMSHRYIDRQIDGSMLFTVIYVVRSQLVLSLSYSFLIGQNGSKNIYCFSLSHTRVSLSLFILWVIQQIDFYQFFSQSIQMMYYLSLFSNYFNRACYLLSSLIILPFGSIYFSLHLHNTLWTDRQDAKLF